MVSMFHFSLHSVNVWCLYGANIPFLSPETVIQEEEEDTGPLPPIFLSYQWGHQPHVKLLRRHLEAAGYHCWMDLGQMGGGDKLFAKVDTMMRAAAVIICCVTEKYAKSANCNKI